MRGWYCNESQRNGVWVCVVWILRKVQYGAIVNTTQCSMKGGEFLDQRLSATQEGTCSMELSYLGRSVALVCCDISIVLASGKLCILKASLFVALLNAAPCTLLVWRIWPCHRLQNTLSCSSKGFSNRAAFIALSLLFTSRWRLSPENSTAYCCSYYFTLLLMTAGDDMTWLLCKYWFQHFLRCLN
jgi:hypothetical protein